MLVRALLLAHVALGGASVAVPTAAQLEWMDMEVGAMITYNLQTYCQPASAKLLFTCDSRVNHL